MRHKRYLKQSHKVRYYNLLTSGKLDLYLADIEEQAQNLFSRLIKDLAEKENVTEKLKSDNQMLWVQKMNILHNCFCGKMTKKEKRTKSFYMIKQKECS